MSRLEILRKTELDLLSKFTSENIMVKFNREQIADLEKQKTALEEKFPDFGAAAAPGGSPPATLGSEKARLEDMEAAIESLKARQANVQEGIKRLAEVGSQVADLERNKELEIANYKYFKGTLEKARIDEALDPTKMPNISTVQKPSPPNRVYGKRDKIVKFLAGGGLGIALAITLLSELLVNQTVKRPLELKKRLGTRLLVSIPFTGGKSRLRLPWKRRSSQSVPSIQGNGAAVAPWEPGHFIRPYAEAIRDRLGLYFELNRMTHKPKLVGVTSFGKGAGTSTLAAGSAAALSETGDGKVLLVDVNLGPGDVHPFFNGRPALPLMAALESNGSLLSAADNLYLATVGSTSAGPAQLGLKKFFDLMPNLQASDFDYVIFDMPPLGQTSPTLGNGWFHGQDASRCRRRKKQPRRRQARIRGTGRHPGQRLGSLQQGALVCPAVVTQRLLTRRLLRVSLSSGGAVRWFAAEPLPPSKRVTNQILPPGKAVCSASVTGCDPADVGLTIARGGGGELADHAGV